jgi:hypothetical protein
MQSIYDINIIGRNDIPGNNSMFFLNHFNLGGGLAAEAEQISTVLSPSLASTIKILDECDDDEECFCCCPLMDLDPLIVNDLGPTEVHTRHEKTKEEHI